MTLEDVRAFALDCLRETPSSFRLWQVVCRRVAEGKAFGFITKLYDSSGTFEKCVGMVLWELESQGDGKRAQVSYLWWDPEPLFAGLGPILIKRILESSPAIEWKFIVSDALLFVHRMLRAEGWKATTVKRNFFGADRDGYVFRKFVMGETDVCHARLGAEAGGEDGGDEGSGDEQGVV